MHVVSVRRKENVCWAMMNNFRLGAKRLGAKRLLGDDGEGDGRAGLNHRLVANRTDCGVKWLLQALAQREAGGNPA